MPPPASNPSTGSEPTSNPAAVAEPVSTLPASAAPTSTPPTSSPSTATPPSPMPPATVVLLLALLLGIQPITTDLYLPALPLLTNRLGASVSQAQLTLTALLLAFGCSQLVWGPLSDRFGRKPVLLAGLAAYTVASAFSAGAAGIEALIVWRALQGATMGAAVMGARAIVRDLYLPLDGARVMSRGLSGLGVLACLSPPLGGLLAQWWGWRATLAVLAVFGAATLALVALRFVETVPPARRRSLQAALRVGSWGQIVRHPVFATWSLLSAASYAGLFTFLGGSSFVFIEVLGLTRLQYGALMCSNALAYIVGTFVCRRLLVRLGVRRTVAAAGALTLAGGGTLALLAWAGAGQPWYGAWAIMGPFYLFMVGHGIHQPCGQSGAVGPFAHAAGTASALNGFAMMLTAFAVGAWLGHALDGTVMPLVQGIAFWSAIITLTAWTLVQRFGEAQQG